jgi:thiamine-phosphate pyrophosphorylase
MGGKAEPERPKPRFVLVTPVIADAAGFASALAAACTAADVAAVILRLAPAKDADTLTGIHTLAAAVQSSDVAVLLDGLAHLVTEAGADGVHFSSAEAVQSARSVVKPDRMVGAGGLSTRHDAMTAGEDGADYVMFGEPGTNGERPPLPALVERVTWWSELFEVPSIAYATHFDEIAPLARAGADFIGLGEELVWNAPEGPLAALTAAADRLQAAELVE